MNFGVFEYLFEINLYDFVVIDDEYLNWYVVVFFCKVVYVISEYYYNVCYFDDYMLYKLCCIELVSNY